MVDGGEVMTTRKQMIGMILHDIATSTISSCDRIRVSTAHEDKLGSVNEDRVTTKGRAALNPTCSILRPESFNGLLCVAIKRCPC